MRIMKKISNFKTLRLELQDEHNQLKENIKKNSFRFITFTEVKCHIFNLTQAHFIIFPKSLFDIAFGQNLIIDLAINQNHSSYFALNEVIVNAKYNNLSMSICLFQ